VEFAGALCHVFDRRDRARRFAGIKELK